MLSSKPSTIEGELQGGEPGKTREATVYVFSEDRASWNISSPRPVRSDVQPNVIGDDERRTVDLRLWYWPE